jgi:hypothetical protein
MCDYYGTQYLEEVAWVRNRYNIPFAGSLTWYREVMPDK